MALDAATGSVSWSQTYDGPASTVDEGHALAVDTSNVYVTGRSTQSGNHFDYATIKYALSNGAHQWTARYNGPGSDWDTAYGVVIAASMIVVTGRSRATAGGYFDYATVGYYAGNGTQKWVDRYNGPDALDDYAFGVASNSDGTSCYVTGRSYRVSSPPVPDVATVKYDCDDGDRVWVKRFTGPIAKGDGGEDIVVDSSGNVYVTGWTGALVGVGTDFLTISYASDGTQRWTHRFNGAGLNSDRAFGVAVNADATAVYVVGESWDLDDANDYVTLSIKASDGTANWSMAYNGVDGGNDILDDVPDLL